MSSTSRVPHSASCGASSTSSTSDLPSSTASERPVEIGTLYGDRMQAMADIRSRCPNKTITLNKKKSGSKNATLVCKCEKCAYEVKLNCLSEGAAQWKVTAYQPHSKMCTSTSSWSIKVAATNTKITSALAEGASHKIVAALASEELSIALLPCQTSRIKARATARRLNDYVKS